jgi:hypothetical protein
VSETLAGTWRANHVANGLTQPQAAELAKVLEVHEAKGFISFTAMTVNEKFTFSTFVDFAKVLEVHEAKGFISFMAVAMNEKFTFSTSPAANSQKFWKSMKPKGL